MDTELLIKFIGKDEGLARTAKVGEQALGSFGRAAEGAGKSSNLLVDSQGRLRNSQGQFVDATKLSRVELERLRGELAANGQNVALFDQRLRDTREGLLGFAAIAGGVSAAVGGIFTQGTQDFLAFEGGIKQAGVVSGATGEEIEALRAEVERLGIVTSKTPAEIAQTSVSLSRAGFTAEETSVALEGVARASEATGESLGTVGGIISETVRTFGLLASETGRVGDVLVATANNSNTTVASIGESLSEVGAFAAGADQPLEDIVVLLGLLGDAGIRGSRAGTNLGAALDRLKAASAGAESEFTNLVRGNQKAVEAFELINANVRNSDGSMRSLLEVIPEIQAGLGSLDSQGDRDLVSRALFGVQGGRAIQTILNATEEQVASLTDEVRNAEGIATESGEALLTGLGGALALLEGSAGAAAIRFGEFAAVGLEPLVRAARAVLDTFLRLPAPIQGAIVATTALTGVIAAAAAALATYNALQVAERAGKIAGAAIDTAKAASQAVLTAATIASSTANGIFNASINAQNIGLAFNATVTQGAAIAKGAYALATGTASQATLGLTRNLGGLAIKAGLVVAAVSVIAELWTRTRAGADYRNDLNEAIAGLDDVTEAAESTDGVLQDLAGRFGSFFDNVRERGVVDALTISIVELQKAVFDAGDATSRFGDEWSPATRAQVEARAVQIATEQAFRQLGSAVQDTSDLLAEYGQALPDGEQLEGEELREFTAAIAAQAQELQAQIEVLEAAKGASEENDAQLQAEINTRLRLIGVLEDRLEAQTGETDAVEQATDAARSLKSVLSELGDEYDSLSAKAAVATDQLIADIAAREADGLISQVEAEQEKLEAEQNALSSSITRNEELLSRLEAQRSQREGEELETLNDEILQVQADLARDERALNESRVAATREAADERQKVLEEAAREEEKILEAAAAERARIFEQEQEDAARRRNEAFGDQQRAEARAFDESEDAAQRSRDEARRAAEAAFNQREDELQERFAEQERLKDAAAAERQRESDRAYEDQKRADTEAFNERQRQADAAFSDRQRQADEAFSERQNAARTEAEGRFAAERLRIERELQLEDAGSSEERDQLRDRFAAEDADAARREQAFAAVVAAEQAFEEQQRAEQAAFEEAQRAQQAAFDEQQRIVQEQYTRSQEALDDARREKIALQEGAREEAAAARRAEFEQQLADLKAANEEQLRADDLAAELAAQDRRQAFEDQQRAEERAFNDAERQLDRENAIAIRNIEAGGTADAPPTVPAFRQGGVAPGGVIQVHQDEFIVAPKNTRVVSQAESRRLVQEFLIQNPITTPNTQAPMVQQVTADNSGIAEKLDTLISATQQRQRPVFKAGGDTYNISGQANPVQSAQKARLDSLRSLVRMNT